MSHMAHKSVKELSLKQICELKRNQWIEYRNGVTGDFYFGQIMKSAKGTGGKQIQIALFNQGYQQETRAFNIDSVLLYPHNSVLGSTAPAMTQHISIGHDVRVFKPGKSQWRLGKVVKKWKAFLQVKLEDNTTWWTHPVLTNELKIRQNQVKQQQTFQQPQQQQHQHGGYRPPQYAQINREQEQTVSVQLLIEATETALDMVKEYSDSLVELLTVGNDTEDKNQGGKGKRKKKGKRNKKKSGNSEEKNDEDEKDEKNIKLNKFEKKVQSCNIKAITGLKLFETQTEAFLEKSEQRGMSKDIGMKNAKSRINKHLEDTENRLKQSGYPDEVIAYVLDRISPFIKGMTSVANGNELPALKTLKRTKVDEKQANSIIAKVLGKLNHDVPDMVSNVRKNYQDISMQHKMNALSVNDEDNNKNKSRGFSKDEANDIYRDIHKPLVYSKGAQQSLIDARKDCDKAREALYNEDPDLGLDDD